MGSGRIIVKTLPRENWAESWKRHFKPMAIGNSLLVKPSWSRQPPRAGQKVIVLDPGLSFGTGQHPTTGFCLRQLARSRSGQAQSFLDIGTGSGILAIAAARLGYDPVEAFDFDPESVRVARANARQNRVAGQLRLFEQDLTRLPSQPERQFDFICANLISTLLLQEKKRIVNRLKSGGVLVLAGILKSEFCSVQTTYEKLGLKFFAGRSEKEWRSGAFCRIV
jgi:ribosomal protein L11 methyltransferase